MKTAVVVPTRTAALLSMHLQALGLVTPEFVTGELAVVAVSNGTLEERKEIRALLDGLAPGLPANARILLEEVVAGEGQPGPFYGQLCHAGAVAAMKCGAEELVFANDDSLPQVQWLDLFREDRDNILALGHLLGLLGARGNCVSGPQGVFHPTEVAYRSRLPRQHPTAGCPVDPMAFCYPRVVTFFAFVESEAYEDSGGFDQDLPAHNFSDDCLSVRMLRRRRHNFVSRAFAAHFGSRTTARGATPEEALARYEDDMKKGQAHYEQTCPDAAELIEGEFRWSGIR